MANRIKAVALALLLVAAAAAQSSVDVGQAREIFGEIGGILQDLHEITGFRIKQGQKSDDGSLARLAVMEGQASWLMAEYLARKVGQSLATSPVLLNTMAHSIESGASEFPVFESEPLYLRETLVFPYSQGLLFQNAVYER